MDYIHDLLFYLPYRISYPLSTILNQVENLSTTSLPTLTQILPIFLSLLALYATIISLYNTTKFALRAIWFTLKWGTLIAVLGSGIIGFKNLTGTGNNNSNSKGLSSSSFGNVGVGDMINLGKKGVDWWSGEGIGGKRGSKRSASGSKRTWSRVNSEGEWDDPNENYGDGSIEEVVEKVQEVVMTFWENLAGGGNSNDDNNKNKNSKSTKSKKLKKKQEKEKNGGNGLNMAAFVGRYAFNKARDMVGF